MRTREARGGEGTAGTGLSHAVVAASIYLGDGTTHCLVGGGPPPTRVLEKGTDDTLINVTPVTDPPAPAATPMNPLKQMKQLKGMMRP